MAKAPLPEMVPLLVPVAAVRVRLRLPRMVVPLPVRLVRFAPALVSAMERTPLLTIVLEVARDPAPARARLAFPLIAVLPV